MSAPQQFVLARVFDLVDPKTGPAFAPDHDVVDDTRELRELVDYLQAGTSVLVTPTLLEDVVDPDRAGVVPTNFLTDGTWVWTDTVTYYLSVYGLAPEAGLRRHVLGQGGPPAPVDATTVRAAAGFVLSPVEEPVAVWSAG